MDVGNASEERREQAEIGVENVSRICIHLGQDEVDDAHFLELARIADSGDEDDPNRFSLSATPEIEDLNRGVMQTLNAMARQRGISFFYDEDGYYIGYADREGYSYAYGGRDT